MDCTDWTRDRGARPWSGDLAAGDLLTGDQAASVDETRLRDFGLVLRYVSPWTGDETMRVEALS